jgi:hypothetical protein
MHPFCDEKEKQKMPACFFQRNSPTTDSWLSGREEQPRFTESDDGWLLTNKTFLHSISNNACSSSNAGQRISRKRRLYSHSSQNETIE